VFFGNGHIAVEVITVQPQEHVRENLALIVRHAFDILADPGENGQVRHGLQIQVFAVGAHQPHNVLALVRPAEGQDEGLVRRAEKAVQLLQHRSPREHGGFVPVAVLGEHIPVVGIKPLHVQPRRDDREIGGPLVRVKTVLLLDLLVGAGDDQVRLVQEFLLDGDALVDLVAPVEVDGGNTVV